MSTQQIVIHQKPEYGKLYGITHDPVTKSRIFRVPRETKVIIGIPKGAAIQPFIFNGVWNIRHGEWDTTGGARKFVMKTVFQGGKKDKYGVLQPNTKEAAEAWHKAHKGDAAVSNRPQKIPYFTFTRRVVEEQNGRLVESFEPDFDAIAAHGDTPRSVPIILTSDSPLANQYQWWTASEMKCHGDGLLAERVLSAGNTNDPGWSEAKAAGEKMFLVTSCFTNGCPHAKVDCKPHSILSFQLANAFKLGATAYFTSTGQVSADRLATSLEAIADPIARTGYSISGIQMDLVLSSFRANFEGKPSLQPCVALQLRATSQEALRRLIAETSWTPQKLVAAAQQLVAGDVLETDFEVMEETDSPAPSNSSFTAEVVEADFDEPEPEESPSPAATATQRKQDEVSKKLSERRRTPPVAPTPAPVTVPMSGPVDEAGAATHKSNGAPVRPWTNKDEMDECFMQGRQRVGAAAFGPLVERHGVDASTAWDDPKLTLMYMDMQALPDEEVF